MKTLWTGLKHATDLTMVKERSPRSLIRRQFSSHGQENNAAHDFQLTLALLKPDIIANPVQSEEIVRLIVNSGLHIVRSKEMKLSIMDAEKFYNAHREKFFYSRLVHFMSSGPLSANILTGHNAIERWRKLMGPTKVFKAVYENPDCIRAKYGLTDTRNVTHGSDSPESAEQEIKFFFPEFDFDDWKSREEQYFKDNHVIFCTDQNVHRIKV